MYETRLGADQLAALAAVVEFGSFDAAAERLHVTPSAVSQRIKALEQRVGGADHATGGRGADGDGRRRRDGAAPRIAVGVNADSMATWFTVVFETLDDVLFDIRIDERDHSARLRMRVW
jgi:LysR family transcriptional regulator (chromosome initiation inhibitor)